VKEEGLMGVGVDVYDRRWERVDIPIRVYGVNGDLEPVVSVQDIVLLRGRVPDALLLGRGGLVVEVLDLVVCVGSCVCGE
jgi:hypothetical protein